MTHSFRIDYKVFKRIKTSLSFALNFSRVSFLTNIKKNFFKLRPYLQKAIYIFLGASVLSVILFRFVPIPVTPLMLIRVAEQWSDNKPLKLKKDWTSLDEISSNLPLAVVCSEDQKFTTHHGFDFEAIEKAYKSNQKKKKRSIRGASTISQQVAKNVFLWPGRSYLRKGLEVYFTVLIELFWSKERIMEVYLNVAEMGNGVYGGEAAARTYFQCRAAKLTKDQAAWLACILPNPRKYSPKKPTAYLQKRHDWIRTNMKIMQKVNWQE
jgi:monofunctional glycosyltransferase